MKRYIKSSVNWTQIDSEYLNWMFGTGHNGLELADTYGLEHDLNIYLDFLESKGFDTVAKVTALINLWRLSFKDASIRDEALDLINDGFSGSSSYLTNLVKTRKQEVEAHVLEQIQEEYDSYYDDASECYVFAGPGGREEVMDIIKRLKRISNANRPAYNYKYDRTNKQYELYIGW